MRRWRILAVILLAGLPQAEAAGAEAPRAGRYTMLPAEGGFVRLDTETGLVTQCLRADPGEAAAWRCSTVTTAEPGAPLPPSPLAGRLDALEAAMRHLSARVDAIAAALPPPPAGHGARGVGSEAMRRLFSLVRGWKSAPVTP